MEFEDTFPADSIVVFKDENGGNFLFLRKLNDDSWMDADRDRMGRGVEKFSLASWIREMEKLEDKGPFTVHALEVDSTPFYTFTDGKGIPVSIDGTTYDIELAEAAEQFCRAFVQKYPTDLLVRLVEGAKQGDVSWTEVATQFAEVKRIMR